MLGRVMCAAWMLSVKADRCGKRKWTPMDNMQSGADVSPFFPENKEYGAGVPWPSLRCVMPSTHRSQWRPAWPDPEF